MVTEQLPQTVGLFPNRQDAEAALNYLAEKGFNLDKISILAKDDEAAKTIVSTDANQAQAQPNRGGAIAGAITGVATGFFSGGLLGALSLRIFAEATPVANVGILFIDALVGAGIGIIVCGLIGSLMGWALTRKSAKSDNPSVNQDNNYLVVVEGSEDNIRQAQSILSNWNH